MYFDWEFQFLNWMQDHLRGEFLDTVMPFITKFGDGGIFWIAVTLLLMIPKRTRKYAHVSAIALIFCVIGGNLILKNVIGRARPFWLDNGNMLARIAQITADGLTQYTQGHDKLIGLLPDGRTPISLLVSAPNDFCFPSGHTQASFAAATAICMYSRKWGIPALVLAALVAFSRMYLYVHYPTDILGGIFCGVVYALIALWICNRLFKNKSWGGCAGAAQPAKEKEAVTMH